MPQCKFPLLGMWCRHTAVKFASVLGLAFDPDIVAGMAGEGGGEGASVLGLAFDLDVVAGMAGDGGEGGGAGRGFALAMQLCDVAYAVQL